MSAKNLLRWLPALLVMVAIFALSSAPGRDLPNFGFWDVVVKKGSHMLGYAALALAYWYGLRFDKRRWWLALLLALLYAMTDEYHQSFTPGRHPSWVDVFLFDGGGAGLGLCLTWLVRRSAKRT